jgi:tRNA (guanine37-N1)-methyltransferase
MAGVGPFAVPAGKKEVLVWANDLNPASYVSLADAIKLNKVSPFVKPFQSDGRHFVSYAVQDLLHESRSRKNIVIPGKRLRTKPGSRTPPKQPPPKVIPIPQTFSHFVLNLPATALTFLDAFVGVYHGLETLFTPHTKTELPLIHVYCFDTKSDDHVEEKKRICAHISQRMDYNMPSEQVELHDVRDVAPNKRMFCASFRLPAEVAFRAVSSDVAARRSEEKIIGASIA